MVYEVAIRKRVRRIYIFTFHEHADTILLVDKWKKYSSPCEPGSFYQRILDHDDRRKNLPTAAGTKLL